MKLKLSFPFVITFLLLLLLMMELHEIVHITAGRFICGCWGARDFNVWSLCDQCQNDELGWVATLAGPLFSFTLMWIGMFLLSSSQIRTKAIGFVFIFSNIPFGRITTVMQGGGDEMVVIRNFMKSDYSRTQMILAGSVLVLLAGMPPIIKAWKTLSNKWSWIYIIGFLTLPLLFLLIYLLIGFNTLLSYGFLYQPWIMGTPLLITLHTGVVIVLLTLFRRNLISFR